MQTVWVFPGQGSQAVDMGADLFNQQSSQEKLQIAQDILGWAIADKCHKEITELSKTQFTQPCLYVISAILIDILKSKGYSPNVLTGHSLGELTALYAAEVIDFATGLELVRERSLLMSQATTGGMTALIGFDRAALEAVIAQTAGVVLANDNSADQVVISGDIEAIKQVCDRVKTKRAIPLPVSGAFHSPMMAGAAEKFTQILAKVEFKDAQIPVLSNVQPHQPTTDPTKLKSLIAQQMTAPVRWREICLYLQSSGYEQAVEIGSGKVLTGLIKRTASNLKLFNISNLNQLAEYVSVNQN
ncbi:malonyl CoA-acyl carrier protein transacylase [Synechococcus sp. PCC 7502]|uniref:ACP S-malonyltransferase n=1 Tax=Synechococcus sp. PCC 7502 TaxID=1173263 RepID=UPI00029F85FB|nr:ACP S-malonyltransferase [Synechococcus sp. PCC 7502]AFY73128.1 malonyl CoA-acyl carrier protein transacylase [Synechococcus sp. PCC 7502]